MTLSARLSSSAALFVVGAALSYFVGHKNTSAAVMTSGIRLAADSPPEVLSLVGHNYIVLIGVLGGLVSFGFLTILALIALGFQTVGPVSDALSSGVHSSIILAATLPHGLFEIPAFVLAGAAGLGGVDLLVQLCRRTGRSVVRELIRSTAYLITMATALLALAAAVETRITPTLIRYATAGH